MTPPELAHFAYTWTAAEHDPGDPAFKARWYMSTALIAGLPDSAVRVLARVAFRLVFRESVWNRRQSMSATHTPGPWKIDEDRPLSEDGPCTEITARRKVVAVVLDSKRDRGRANARLIAAAPELLALLSHVLARYDGANEERRDNAWPDDQRTIYARTLLARLA